MDGADPRAALERLVRERGEDYAGLSRIIGRNPAYVQQYIKRGVPKRLPEHERRELARYFRVPEEMLGKAGDPAPEEALVPVSRHDVGASAGPGATAIDERGVPAYAFDRRMLRGLTGGRTEALGIVTVRGESMQPTLQDGDDILVDRNPEAQRLRDGIYVLRLDGALMVKRIAARPGGFDVVSDNPAYPPWPISQAEEIDVVGRVIWSGRRVA